MARRIEICNCTKTQLDRGETCGLASCYNRHRRRRRKKHPYLRSDGRPTNAVPTVEAGVDGRVLDLLNSHPDFDRSAFAWVGSEHMGDGLFCASIYTDIAADSPYMWIADPVEVIAKTGVRVAPSRAELMGEEQFMLCVFVGEAKGSTLVAVEECGADDLAVEALRMLDSAVAR
jgi:hypothetical protein